MKKPIVPAGGLCGLQVCAVCLAEYDSPSVLHGPLFKARRAYYENGNRVRVSLVTRSRGVTTHYHGVISHTGFKWKESSETGAFCRSFRLRGQDICLYYERAWTPDPPNGLQLRGLAADGLFFRERRGVSGRFAGGRRYAGPPAAL